MTFTHALATNNYGPAKFIVSSSAANGTHTTIGTALSSATSGDTIFIRPGTYSEDITLKAGVNLTAFGSDSSVNGSGAVIISGTCTMTTAGSVSIYGIQLQKTSAVFLAVTGSAASVVNLIGCYLNCANNTGITFSSSSGSAKIYLKNCYGDLGTTGVALFAHSSSGVLQIDTCYFSNSGGSSTASTISAGTFSSFYSTFFSPLTSSGTATFAFSDSGIDSSAQNVTCVTCGGSGNHTLNGSSFTSGSASSITVTASAGVINCYVNSSNTNAISGAGSIIYGTLSFSGTSQKISTATQSGGVIKGGQSQAPSTGFVGESVSSANTSGVSLTNNTPANITSISLTAGIWDVVGAIQFNPGAATANTSTNCSISTTSATDGTAGDNLFQGSVALAATRGGFAMVPSYRLTLTATTTVYLVADAGFTGGTLTGIGRITATREG